MAVTYLEEPPLDHARLPRTGVLLVNLGTPEAPSPAAVRAYLREFLTDARVVELPRLVWWPLLYGVVLPIRAKRSAAKYASIWSEDGSPLAVHTRRQALLLKGYLGSRTQTPLTVDYAMRYGRPSVLEVIAAMKRAGVTRLLVLPLYPQYAASSTGSALDAVYAAMTRLRFQPALRTLTHFHDHPGYIAALADKIRRHWQDHGRGGRLVMSFHGLPRASLDKGDPYYCHCQKTARLLAEALGLGNDEYVVTFQSRFGRAEWLKPYTQATLESLARQGITRVDVICPGFVADCLETLEEIAMECRQAYLAAGGKTFHYIPALNDDPAWIAALADIVAASLCGWLGEDKPLLEAEAAARAARARALGAPS